MLRGLNPRLGDDVRRGGVLSPLVDGIVAGDALAPRRSTPIVLGPDDLSASWVAWPRGQEVTVHGDLDDLLPAPLDDDWTDPDKPRKHDVTAAALDTVVLLAEVAGRPLPWRERGRRALARLRR